MADPSPAPLDLRTMLERWKADWKQYGVDGIGVSDCIDQLEAALAVSRPTEGQGWQPIASAREETIVLVHDEGYVGKGMLSGGKWLDVEIGCGDAIFDPAPTEWQALPAPPVAAPQENT